MTVVRGFVVGKEFGHSSESSVNKLINELSPSAKAILQQAIVSNSSAVLPSPPVDDGSEDSRAALKAFEEHVKVLARFSR